MLTITQIQEAVKRIAPQYPIKSVQLFGSYADGAADDISDIDVLVEFSNKPVTLLDYCGFQEELSDHLRTKVDIVKFPLSASAEKSIKISKVVLLYEQYIPWKKIQAMRNVAAHKYEVIDPQIIWNTVKISIPELEEAIKNKQQ